MIKLDGLTILAVALMAALVLDTAFDWFWNATHRSSGPLSVDDRKRFWKVVVSACVALIVVVTVRKGILTALGMKVGLPLDMIATAILIAAGTDKFAQIAGFLAGHENLAAPVVQVKADHLTYTVSGEMTMLD